MIIAFSNELESFKKLIDDVLKDGAPRKISGITGDSIRIGARIAKSNRLRFAKNYAEGYLIIAPPKERKEITYTPKRRDVPQVIEISPEQLEDYNKLRRDGIEYHRSRMEK